MGLGHQLERFRYVVFMGKSPAEPFTALTQEEYIDHYEGQLARDPAAERKLIGQLSAPILPFYRRWLEQAAQMEQIITGEKKDILFSDQEVLDELYDEVTNLETEAEWQEFKKKLGG